MHTATLRTIDDLVTAGLLAADAAPALAPVVARYALAVTPAMADLIDCEDAHDPIARQFLPDVRELIVDPVERADPIGDDRHSPLPGLVHRHADRVLLKLTAICPVYCRFCFRREMIGPAADREMTATDIAAAVAYVAADPAITEVILTGGDPLVLSPRRIAAVTTALGAIPHVSVIRWHTRVPVVAPDRVSDDLVAALGSEQAMVYVAVHANHAREFTAEARGALKKLRNAGIVLLGQSVLLKGVNADIAALSALMRAFVAAGVKPYYLHHPDLVPGTGHMRVPIAEGQRLVEQLRGTASGLAQPTYVLDIPGGVAKVAIGSTAIAVDDTGLSVRDPAGRLHRYPPAAAAD